VGALVHPVVVVVTVLVEVEIGHCRSHVLLVPNLNEKLAD
jgi:hypothetical protein